MRGRGPSGGFWARAVEFRRAYQAPEGLFWIKRINHTIGALIAFLLLRTSVTPNVITVAGLLAVVAGAVVVALVPPPASIVEVVFVGLAWQLGFALDCADGPLARARGQTSSFGAWLDQLVDTLGRSAIYVALAVFLVRSLGLDGVEAVLVGSIPLALALLQTFASWQRALVVGGASPIGDVSRAGSLLRAGQQLVDYGAFLFVAAVALLVPPVLLGFLILLAVVDAAFVGAQVALGWRRHLRASASVRVDAATGRRSPPLSS